MGLDLPSHLTQWKHGENRWRQQFSRSLTSVNESHWSLRNVEQMRWNCSLSQAAVLWQLIDHGFPRGTRAEPCRLPELWRQNRDQGCTKATTVYRAGYWRGDCCTGALWRTAAGPLELWAECWSVHSRKPSQSRERMSWQDMREQPLALPQGQNCACSHQPHWKTSRFLGILGRVHRGLCLLIEEYLDLDRASLHAHYQILESRTWKD